MKNDLCQGAMNNRLNKITNAENTVSPEREVAWIQAERPENPSSTFPRTEMLVTLTTAPSKV